MYQYTNNPEHDYTMFIIEQEKNAMEINSELKARRESYMSWIRNETACIVEAIGQMDDTFILTLVCDDTELAKRIKEYFLKCAMENVK